MTVCDEASSLLTSFAYYGGGSTLDSSEVECTGKKEEKKVQNIYLEINAGAFEKSRYMYGSLIYI